MRDDWQSRCGIESVSDNGFAFCFPFVLSMSAWNQQSRKTSLYQKSVKTFNTRSVNIRNIFRLCCTLKHRNTIPTLSDGSLLCGPFVTANSRMQLYIKAHIFSAYRVHNARHILFPSRPAKTKQATLISCQTKGMSQKTQGWRTTQTSIVWGNEFSVHGSSINIQSTNKSWLALE